MASKLSADEPATFFSVVTRKFTKKWFFCLAETLSYRMWSDVAAFSIFLKNINHYQSVSGSISWHLVVCFVFLLEIDLSLCVRFHWEVTPSMVWATRRQKDSVIIIATKVRIITKHDLLGTKATIIAIVMFNVFNSFWKVGWRVAWVSWVRLPLYFNLAPWYSRPSQKLTKLEKKF